MTRATLSCPPYRLGRSRLCRALSAVLRGKIDTDEAAKLYKVPRAQLRPLVKRGRMPW